VLDSPLQVAINAQLVSFAQSARNSGVSRFTYALLNGLAHIESNQRYIAFVNTDSVSEAAAALAASGRVELVASRWKTERPQQRILWEQLALPGELRRRRVDVFHSPVNVLPERLPCASVVTVHDLAFVHYPQYFRPGRRIYQRIFTSRSVRAATLVVADSESTRRDLITQFAVPPAHTRVVYPAVDADFTPELDPQVRAAFRARQHLPERYLLYLGTLEPRKNLPGLVEAYARLRAHDATVPPLVIAGGKGWYYQTVFDAVRAHGLERDITFAGYVLREEQRLWYSCAELFVYPSVYEGFGLPVAEALACGVPTITSSVSSLPEAGGPVATCVGPDDPEALAQAMHRVLNDPQARVRTLAEGPQWANRFTTDGMAREYMQIYREAVEASVAQRGERGR
jgi:glycosyltransferase involved in cell wall biosynthesis